MSNQNLDLEIKKHLKGKKLVIPDVVKDRVTETLHSLPERKSRSIFYKRKKLASIATASIVAVAIGIGTTSTSLADTIKQIPVFESVFQLIGEESLNKAREKGMVSTIGESAVDEGIKVTVTEVLHDGTMISIGYLLESEEKLDSLLNPKMNFQMDGKPLGTYGVGGSSTKISENKLAGVFHLNIEGSLKDHFQLDMGIEKLGDINGDWHFTFPVTKSDKDSKSIMPMATKNYGGTSVILEKLTFSVSSTEVLVKIVESKQNKLHYTNFELIDDKGQMLGMISSSGKINKDKLGQRYKLVFSPSSEIPKSIILRPTELNHERLDVSKIKGLEVEVEIGS
ncbi:DUF4179 domain-containing protein [Bacillus sp. 31A1R]|uniref:DUF4179 domain-containing protein n=1 Tax=Robertmurraya mangrovi TaxID=3098077 RepID=A0ABU5J5E2_9BACI|nr:DUF4179 domain-containing protein [Bacillus sp. 31A1R]MDZ5474602.1 DUF4179 domain-containing protein [Bacillus sp. 31A1R]